MSVNLQYILPSGIIFLLCFGYPNLCEQFVLISRPCQNYVQVYPTFVPVQLLTKYCPPFALRLLNQLQHQFFIIKWIDMAESSGRKEMSVKPTYYAGCIISLRLISLVLKILRWNERKPQSTMRLKTDVAFLWPSSHYEEAQRVALALASRH